ncbi:MAG: hypothetical protein CSA81_06540 [Acidobacteria bacterium]|nr:MAG: hypothetical protein CSA81_06540 [Acidobacteriota bacterium]
MKKDTLSWPRLAGLLAFATLSTWALQLTGSKANWPDAETVTAMETYIKAQERLWAERERLINEEIREELRVNDPLKTGIVGVEWSSRTTTPGSLEAKRTTAHPLWIAVLRNWFLQAGVKAGDTIAIGASGSFPGMVIAARIAAESMQLNVRFIGSLTSSNYGANIPEMDIARMDEILRLSGLLKQPPLAFTPGGSMDLAMELEKEDRRELFKRMNALGSLQRIPTGLQASINWREELLLNSKPEPKVFINIGGSASCYGVGAAPLAIPSGLILASDHRARFESKGDSVTFRALRRGMNVIHLLHIRGLAAENGIPYDPAHIPSPAILRLPDRVAPLTRILAGLLSLVMVIALIFWRVPKPGPKDWFHSEEMEKAV